MTRERLVLAVFLLSVPLALAQHWDIEQVDSAGWGRSVEMRWHPDGRLFLCYSSASGAIRLASKDSGWHYEDVPQRRRALGGTQAFDINERGSIGIAYLDDDNRYWYTMKIGVGWTDEQMPFYSWTRSPIALDTAGKPVIAVQLGDAFLLARMRDTLWVTNTLATGYSGFNNGFGCSTLGSRADGAVWGIFWYSFSYPGKDVYGTNLYSFQARDSDVSVALVRDATGGVLYGASGCVDQHGAVHSCYAYGHYGVQGTYLDQTQIDPVRTERTAVKFDSLDRPQIAYVPSDGGLMYRYLGPEGWHVFDLQTSGLTALDLILDENSQPLIAYTTSAGVFLAHGVDVAGQSEESKPQATSFKPQATVVRGVLLLDGDCSRTGTVPKAVLLDISGRKVLDLHSGMNDVGGLPSGVYFVRDVQAQAVSKVVIAR